jgi:hypothetical protein
MSCEEPGVSARVIDVPKRIKPGARMSIRIRLTALTRSEPTNSRKNQLKATLDTLCIGTIPGHPAHLRSQCASSDFTKNRQASADLACSLTAAEGHPTRAVSAHPPNPPTSTLTPRRGSRFSPLPAGWYQTRV